MQTIKCLKCGQEFAAPNDEDLEISCPYCNAKIKITHVSTLDLVKSSCKKAYGKTTDFLKNHPKIAKGIFIGALAGLAAYTAKSEFDTLTADISEPDFISPELPEHEYSAPIAKPKELYVGTSTNASIEPTIYTDEEYHLLDKLSSGALNGDFGEPLLDNGYGSSLQLEIREGVPVRVKCGPGGKFFNGEENERWDSAPRVDTKWRTDDQKLFFLKKYGFLSDDEEVKAYSTKFKGKV